jgi:hypothetical protein
VRTLHNGCDSLVVLHNGCVVYTMVVLYTQWLCCLRNGWLLCQAPALRTHAESVATGMWAQHYVGSNKDHPATTEGIFDWCPLSCVQMFDLIRDTTCDFMHHVLYYPHHCIKAMEGLSSLAAPRMLVLNSKEQDPAEYYRRDAENERRRGVWERSALASTHIQLSQAQKNLVQSRFYQMLGKGKFGHTGKGVFEGRNQMLTSDWLHLLETCDLYIFYGIFPEPQASAYFGFTGIFRLLLQLEFNIDEPEVEAQARLAAVKLDITERLCMFECHWPQYMFSGPVVHNLVHFADLVYKWNNVRNYWCFFNERFIGWLKNFITNRNESTANMVDSYTAVTLLRRAPTFVRAALQARCRLCCVVYATVV